MSIAEQVLSHTPEAETAPEGAETPLDGHEQAEATQQKAEDPKLSLIAKLERKIKLQEQELKKREGELSERMNKLKHWEELENEQDPLKLMGKKGWDLEKLNKYALENLGEEELDPVAKKFKEFEDILKSKDTEWEKKLNEAISAKEQEIRQREYDSQISQFKSEIKSYLGQNKDEFELVNAYEADGPDGKVDGIGLVYDVIYADLQNQAKHSGNSENLKPMDVKLAAEKVEKYLDSQVQKYLNLNKYKSRKSQEEDALESFLGKSQTPKTLDSSFVPRSASLDQLSEKEREQRAIELIKRGF